jgi:hypothetical protein
MPVQIDAETYKQLFPPSTDDATQSADIKSKRQLALEHALDIRKFEIQLYWTRATYFWTFIAAALGAFGAVQTVDDKAVLTDLSVFLSCIGAVLSFAWYCANRGSKQWQENWENHVDLLEDDVTGPLYKVVLTRPKKKKVENEGMKETVKRWGGQGADLVTGPASFSVSKINQLISLYLTAVWISLLFYALPPISPSVDPNWDYLVAIGLAVIACGFIAGLGRSHDTDYSPDAKLRKVAINTPPIDPSPFRRWYSFLVFWK